VIVSTAAGAIQDQPVDTLVLNLFEGVKPGAATGAVDEAIGGAISRAIDLGDFKGKLNSVLTLYPGDRIHADRVIVVGLGKREEFTPDRASQAVASALKAARSLGARNVAAIAFGSGAGGLETAEAAEATVLGAMLGLYRFDRYKKPDEDDEKREIETLRLVEFHAPKLRQIREGVRDGRPVAEAVILARDLANTPSSDMTPTVLAEEARKACREAGVKCRVLGPAAIRRGKFETAAESYGST